MNFQMNFLKCLSRFMKLWQTNFVTVSCVQYGYSTCWETCTKTNAWLALNAFLDRYETDVNELFSHLVTGVKTSKGCFLVDSMEQGSSIMLEVYYEMLRNLTQAIQNKEQTRGMLISGILLHTLLPIQINRLSSLNGNLSAGHPPYSPDPALSNFHVFLRLKKWLTS